MVKITFPDGSVREYEQGVTGLQIAESISPALARNVVSCGVNGETVELNRPINEDAAVELYKFEDEEGKHTFWHTSAHLLAEALQELYPGIQFGFGPAIENGFFYDVMPKAGDVISVRESAKKQTRIIEALELAGQNGFPAWLSVDAKKMEGTFKNAPARDEIAPDINEALVVEFYSR